MAIQSTLSHFSFKLCQFRTCLSLSWSAMSTLGRLWKGGIWSGSADPGHWSGYLLMYVLVLSALPLSPLSLSCTLHSRTLEKTNIAVPPLGKQGAYMRPPQVRLPRCPLWSSLLSYITKEQETPWVPTTSRSPKGNLEHKIPKPIWGGSMACCLPDRAKGSKQDVAHRCSSVIPLSDSPSSSQTESA